MTFETKPAAFAAVADRLGKLIPRLASDHDGEVTATVAAIGRTLTGAGRGQKSTARAEATRRWPRHADTFARARDDGRAESALIGLAGIMRERAGR